MAKFVGHVMPALNGGWAVRSVGAERALKTYPTKVEAVRHARKLAGKLGRNDEGTLYIHKEDGSVSEKRSFAGGSAAG